MIRFLRNRFFRTLHDDESGSATVEFVIVFPVFITMMTMSVELGLVTMRHTLVERGMDMAVRDLRLGTGRFAGEQTQIHDQIKAAVCENALLLADCETQLRLEMRSADLFSFTSLDSGIECTDASEPAKPLKDDSFVPGQANELMLLRACYRFNPIFPTELLGNLVVDDTGQGAIVSMTAFVQEP
ncbi:MAG: TadE family protein [Pseudomonadota bacterium]